MANPYLGQISAFGFGYAPPNWLPCAGQLIPINQYSSLYSLIGSAFGGNGTTTFGLPDLRGVAIYGAGIGMTTGSETVTLDATQFASHSHPLNAISDMATLTAAAGNLLATTGVAQRGSTFDGYRRYSDSAPTSPMSAQSLSPAGGGGSHNNMQPYMALNFCISLLGDYPEFS